MDTNEKLERAREAEARAEKGLEEAALALASFREGGTRAGLLAARDDLKAAAKKWTNAYHGRSRAEKAAGGR